MAIRFEGPSTAVPPEAAFLQAGRRFNKRLVPRTFLPGTQFVAAGPCDMVCDVITAYSHVAARAKASLAIRRFRPRVGKGVSILAPGYATQAQLARSVPAHLTQAILAMQDEVAKAVRQRGHGIRRARADGWPAAALPRQQRLARSWHHRARRAPSPRL